MARTEVRSEQIGDGQVKRDDLAIAPSGSAVVRKLVQGTNIELSSTGADAGTGDVTIALPNVMPRGVVDYWADTRADYVRTSAKQIMDGMTRTLAMIAGRRYRFTGHATFNRSAFITYLDAQKTHFQIDDINATYLDATEYTISDTINVEDDRQLRIVDNGNGTWTGTFVDTVDESERNTVYGILEQDNVEIGRFGEESLPVGGTSQCEGSTIYVTTTGNHVYTLRTSTDGVDINVISSVGVWMLIEDIGTA